MFSAKRSELSRNLRFRNDFYSIIIIVSLSVSLCLCLSVCLSVSSVSRFTVFDTGVCYRFLRSCGYATKEKVEAVGGEVRGWGGGRGEKADLLST